MSTPKQKADKRMITMNDIAARAGVSRPTVSVVLNDRYQDIGIAEETRLRILAIAAEMGYRRNQLAIAVKTGKSRTIGFLAGTVHLEYASRIFAGLLDAAESRGYSIQRFSISDSGEDPSVLVRCVEHRLAGVVVYDPDLHVPFEAMRQEFDTHDIPAVLVDFKTPQKWGINVASDDETGARLAVQHLVDLGHRRIAFFGGIENVGTSVPRYKGYKEAMEENGLGAHVEVFWSDWLWGAAEKQLRAWGADSNSPTAILFGSDPLALQALRAFRATGNRLPEDKSVVGFGDLLRTHLADPSLTTVAVPYEEMGREAVRLLLESGQGGGKSMEAQTAKLIPTRLTLRRINGATPPKLGN